MAEFSKGNNLIIETSEGVTLSSINWHFLEAEKGGSKITIAVPQPDYGKVTHLAEAKTGQIAVMGQKISYLLDIDTNNGDIFVSSKQEFPGLYGKPCGFFGWFMGSCQRNNVYFSNTLHDIFFEGFDNIGVFRSNIVGLSDEPIDISRTPYPHYVGDIEPSSVLLRGETGDVLYDGSGTLQPCG
jgi:hypothetical protein